MSHPTWHFPPHIPGYLAQDPVQREFFTDERIGGLDQALVRESIQNALDATTGETAIVVRFASIKVEAKEYQPYLRRLLPHLKAVFDSSFDEAVFKQPMRFLIVEDFNTIGLQGNPDIEYIDTPLPQEHFYYFWRNVGRTGKKAGNLGRWGLGKTVFPAISDISTFWGLTVRENDRRHLLMGQSVLKHHMADDTPRTPYGYFGNFINDLALPIEDPTEVDLFCNTFRLRRQNEPGLSIVIPMPHIDEQSPLRRIAMGALHQYFYPILTEKLHLIINDTPIKADGLEQMIEKYADEDIVDKENFRKLLSLTRWSLNLEDEQYIQLDEPDLRPAPDWNKYLREEQISEGRQFFEAYGRVAFRVGMKVVEKGANKGSVGWFKVVIERDEQLNRAESHFLRNGIRLLEIKGHSIRGIRAMVIIEDELLGRMLGDAENPAHTDWQKDAPSFQKYEHGPSSLSFVKNSLTVLASKLTEFNQKVEKDLLKDVFFLEEQPHNETNRFSDSANSHRSPDGKTPKPVVDIESKPQPIYSQPIAGGIEIGAIPELAGKVSTISIEFAYEVRKGNAFQKYNPLDFDLGDSDSIFIHPVGAVIEKNEANFLQFFVLDPDFRVQVRGFDTNRDVAMKITLGEPAE